MRLSGLLSFCLAALLALGLGVWLGSPVFWYRPESDYLRYAIWFHPRFGPEIITAQVYGDRHWALLSYGDCKGSKPPRGIVWDPNGVRIQ